MRMEVKLPIMDIFNINQLLQYKDSCFGMDYSLLKPFKVMVRQQKLRGIIGII